MVSDGLMHGRCFRTSAVWDQYLFLFQWGCGKVTPLPVASVLPCPLQNMHLSLSPPGKEEGLGNRLLDPGHMRMNGRDSSRLLSR